MEQSVKNAIIFHGDKMLQLQTMNADKFGEYKDSVIIMLTVIKSVVNGLKNETEPAVLINGMIDNITKQLSINETIVDPNEDILDKILTEVKTTMRFLIAMNDETLERRKLCDTRYAEAKKSSDIAMQVISEINPIQVVKTDNIPGEGPAQ